MIIDDVTTAIDIAFNLSGSLRAFPEILSQLPMETDRIGFDDLPELYDDLTDIGQTWTPELSGRDFKFVIPVYNGLAIQKAPYTTPLPQMRPLYDGLAYVLYIMINNGVLDLMKNVTRMNVSLDVSE